MPTANIKASPNEAERILQEERKGRRLLRLKQVREQERSLAALRRTQYIEKAGREWAGVVDQLQDNWNGRKAETLSSLQEQQERCSVSIGEAHEHAQVAAANKAASVQRLREAVASAQQREVVRSGIAGEKFQEEEHCRTAPLLQKRLLLLQISQTERLRASTIAQQRREYLASTVPDSEIPSNPQPRTRYGKENYANTCFHRAIAVRCETDRDRPSAKEAASAAAAVRVEALRKRVEMEREEKVVADGRGRVAMQGILMDQRKETLEKELQNLVKEDRKRRMMNAMYHARLHQNAYLDVDEEELKERFARQFRIGDHEERHRGRGDFGRSFFDGSTEDSLQFIVGGE